MSPAPNIRVVDALTGAKAPTAFFRALSEADNFCSEHTEVEVQALRAENVELRAQLDEVRTERDALRAKANRRGW